VDNIVESSGLLRHLIARELDAGVPSERILLAGFSQGGAIVLHTALRYEKPLAGILALSTYLPTVDTLAGERSDANRKIPIMMAHGQNDPMIHVHNAEKTRAVLTEMAYSIQWHDYPMEHQVCMEEIGDIRAWMLEIMQPAQ